MSYRRFPPSSPPLSAPQEQLLRQLHADTPPVRLLSATVRALQDRGLLERAPAGPPTPTARGRAWVQSGLHRQALASAHAALRRDLTGQARRRQALGCWQMLDDGRDVERPARWDRHVDAQIVGLLTATTIPDSPHTSDVPHLAPDEVAQIARSLAERCLRLVDARRAAATEARRLDGHVVVDYDVVPGHGVALREARAARVRAAERDLGVIDLGAYRGETFLKALRSDTLKT